MAMLQTMAGLQLLKSMAAAAGAGVVGFLLMMTADVGCRREWMMAADDRFLRRWLATDGGC